MHYNNVTPYRNTFDDCQIAPPILGNSCETFS